jgi:hypothetical protein
VIVLMMRSSHYIFRGYVPRETDRHRGATSLDQPIAGGPNALR